VRYTVIETRYDEIVTPYTSAFLPGSNVRNITLQDSCILDGSDHILVAYDRVALRFVQNALDPQHPRPLICVPVLSASPCSPPSADDATLTPPWPRPRRSGPAFRDPPPGHAPS